MYVYVYLRVCFILVVFIEEVTQTLSAKSSIAFDFAVSAKNSTVFDFDYSKAISGDDMSDRELTPPQSLPAQLLERAQSLGIPLESARSIRNARASIDMGTITSVCPSRSAAFRYAK